MRFVAALVVLCACDPMPDASDAQQAFRDHRRSIDAVDAALRGAVRELPQEVRCADPASVVAAQSPAADRAFEECTARRAEWRSARLAALQRLRRETLHDLLDAHHDVLGIEIALENAESAGTLDASNAGTPATGGVGIDGFDVGWHLYQTAFAYVPAGETRYLHTGDDEARPGIEVAWSIDEGEVAARARMVVLIEGETDAAWRRAHRRAAGR